MNRQSRGLRVGAAVLEALYARLMGVASLPEAFAKRSAQAGEAGAPPRRDGLDPPDARTS